MKREKWSSITHGMPDSLFQGNGYPMTKEEIRMITLCKIRLQPDSVLYDIGAGTGSISIEAARLLKEGNVFAVEKNERALSHLRENSRRFELDNLQVVAGQAPACLTSLPPADRFVIGGSGGRLTEILEVIEKKMQRPSVLVINMVTLETLYSAWDYFRERQDFTCDLVQVQLNRCLPSKGLTMVSASNPVFILTVTGE